MDRGTIGQVLVRYRGVVIAVVLLSLCASGIAFVLEGKREKQRLEEGDAMYDALQGDYRQVVQKLGDLSGEAKGIMARMAQFRLAAHHVRGGDVSSARSLYKNLAQDMSLGREFRELAEYLGIILAVGEGDLSQELEDRLYKLISGKDSVYRSSAREALVFIKIKKGQVEEAGKIAKEALADPLTNAEVKRSVENLSRVHIYK
ncbi:hypothetical protein [Candidatus Anaplasma sp. TIGMIC]|uniref:hypothetical protein n=1 Tax=Candidatus Anaplasma sp. TIGMIC TaxID=3020713 RepID=UPI00232B1BE9|nr:hypothetical protein [Candidatus Anaplasma sp. TIGMIC]